MEDIKTIVKGTQANLTHICNGKAYYRIDTENNAYQLEINCLDAEWNDVYIQPAYKTITLMRWIRKSIEKNDDSFIVLK